MPDIFVLEETPWFVSGLRRAFPENSSQILFRTNAPELIELHQKNDQALLVLDLDSLPEAGMAVFSTLLDFHKMPQIILLVNRSQQTIIWEMMQLGALCYLKKPISARILEQLCRRVLS